MNKNNILSFLIGATVGSLATYFIMKKKKFDSDFEVIETIKRTPKSEKTNNYQNKEVDSQPTENADKNKTVESESENLDDESKKEYVNYVKMYTNSDVKNSDIVKPYIISEEEFDTTDNKVESLMWYQSSNILCDDMDQIIDDDLIDNLIGDKSILKSFEENDSDCIYIRDDVKKIDYEILLSLRDYEPNRAYRTDSYMD